MKIVMFYHSLQSDWNHGNAHFLRGIVTELKCRGHEVIVFEPRDAWSVQNLLADQGSDAITKFQTAYPRLHSVRYDLARLDLDEALDQAQLVLVHEWNSPELVRRIGDHHAKRGAYSLLFHDTHHRMISDPKSLLGLGLELYDGVLAYGRVLQELYEGRGQRCWTWHEAADTRVFHPRPTREAQGDVVWIGNWGDDERASELQEFLIGPIKSLGASARVYGVRYPQQARDALADAGIAYGGWLPNFEVPEVFSRFRATVHVPRRPYVKALPGIPTIRPFEALACGIPLICSPWRDVEGLFTAGEDFLIANNGEEMARALRAVLSDTELAASLSQCGLKTIRSRHTCAHRVDELLAIEAQIRHSSTDSAPATACSTSAKPPNKSATPTMTMLSRAL